MCMLQIRALLYVGALSNGILEALAHAERAITNAIVTPVLHPCCACVPLLEHSKLKPCMHILGVAALQRTSASACRLACWYEAGEQRAHVRRCVTCGRRWQRCHLGPCALCTCQ